MIVLMGKNSYIEDKGKGDRYENLSPKEYLDMIRSYLRDLVNEHKTPMKAGKVFNDESKFGEWKIQLKMINNCISPKNFEETHSIYLASKPTETFMGSDTDDIMINFFILF